MKYTVQLIGSSYHGNGVGFCRKLHEVDDLRLSYSCHRANRHAIDASSCLIGQWLKIISACRDCDFIYMSHIISKVLYESNNSIKSTDHNVIICKTSEETFIAEVVGELKTVDGELDIDEVKIISRALIFGDFIVFSSKSSWLYKMITSSRKIYKS